MTKNARMKKEAPSQSPHSGRGRPSAVFRALGAALALSALAGFGGSAWSDPPAVSTSSSAFDQNPGVSAVVESTRLYFSVAPDMRRCVSPRCGGFWVKAVNQRVTVCADGTSAEACYVANIDWRAMGGNPEISAATVIVQGSLGLQAYPGIGDLGVLVAHDAWGSATSLPPAGVYYRLSDSGIRCVTAPCFNVDAEVINQGVSGRLSGYDLGKVGASDEQLKLAELAFRKGRLLAAGSIYPDDSTTRPGLELVASQFFLPARWWCYSDADCGTAERCNAAEVCLPPPGCWEGAACPTVCTGYCLR